MGLYRHRSLTDVFPSLQCVCGTIYTFAVLTLYLDKLIVWSLKQRENRGWAQKKCSRSSHLEPKTKNMYYL